MPVGSDTTGDSKRGNDPSVKHLVTPGILLFLDQIIVAAGAWIFWIVIPKFTTTSEIGQATSVYSLVMLIGTIAQLGLEYPLLKKSRSDGLKTFGTVLVIEVVITSVSVAPMLILLGNSYDIGMNYIFLAVGLLLLYSISFVSRFALLGLSKPQKVLLFDVLGTAVKFATGITLVYMGYGGEGILLAFFLQAIIVTAGTFFASRRQLGFGLGGLAVLKDSLKDGLVNSPSKFSSMLIVSLCVVLLASSGVENDEVGIFYIAVMASIVAGSFASSLAYMSIPASGTLGTDLSSSSLRIGLAFTVPVIASIIIVPGPILSIIGEEYSKSDEVLVILAAGILPSVILSNAASKFNNLNKKGTLLVVGLIRIISFLIFFYLLVPQHGTIGAAYSILISFAGSALLSLAVSNKRDWKYVSLAIVAILIGVTTPKAVQQLLVLHPVFMVLISTATSILWLLAMKCISLREVSALLRTVKR